MPEASEQYTKKNLPKIIKIAHLALTLILLLAVSFLLFKKNPLNNTLNAIKQQQSQLQITQMTTKKVLQNEVNAQQVSLQQLQFNVVKLLKTSAQSERNHDLAIIRSLIYEAQNTLNFNQDFSRALSLLQKAKKETDALNQPDTLLLSQTLKKSIDQITHIIKSFNLENTLVSINKAQTAIVNLKTQPQIPPKQLDTTTANKPRESHWYSGITTVLHGFKDLISIEHHQQPVHPLPTIKQYEIIKNNIDIKFNLLQWALVRHNQELFSLSLKSIKNKLATFPKQPAITNALITLKPLESLQINPPTPLLTEDINAINQLLSTEKQQPVNK